MEEDLLLNERVFGRTSASIKMRNAIKFGILQISNFRVRFFDRNNPNFASINIPIQNIAGI
jgi:hypothetical protein